MKRWKRVLSVALASSLALGLCACNKEGGGLFGGGDKKEVSANAALAKEYVYRMEAVDFSALQTAEVSDCSVQKILYSGDNVYMVFNIYGTDGSTVYKMLSMKTDGSDVKYYDFQTGLNTDKNAGESAAGSTDENQESDSATAIQPRTEEEEKISADAGIDSDMSLDEEFYSNYVYENVGLNNFVVSGDKIYASKIYYYEDYSDPENYISVRDYYVCCWDFEGNMLWETPLEALSDENAWYNITTVAIQPDGKVAVLIGGEDCGVIYAEADGRVTDLQQISAMDDIFDNASNFVAMSDGKLLVTYYNNDWSELFVANYDFATDTLSEPQTMPSAMSYSGMSNLSVDANGDLVYVDTQGIFKYHMSDAEPKQMMSFVNSDLNVSWLDGFAWLDDEHFVGLYSVYDEYTYKRSLEGGIFTKVAPENIPDKDVLVMGGVYIPSDIKNRVVNFNKSSNTHRIVIKDYSQYNTNEDYMGGYTQLNNDIIAGNMPDMLIVDSYGMSVENYAAKGLLADIGELIATDEELANVEFMDNVFNACKIDGKLYEIIPAFSVSTYIGKTSVVGSHSSWTMEDAQKLLSNMPEGTNLFGDMTRDGYLNMIIEICGRDFVDVSTGKCNFDSEEFISLMEFAMTLPEEITYDYSGDDWYIEYENQYRENRTILSSCYISNIQNLVYTINGSFGENVTFIGMPKSSGNGSAIYTSTTYAISAESDYVDVAWKFMKYYLTDEYQDTLSWQLPVGKKQFDILAQKATKKPVYEDHDGMPQEDEYYYWINDENVILEPLTQKQVYNIINYISSVNTRVYYNRNITNIVTEEMDAYYSGQKSAKEVAGIIQSRVQLYVNENR